MADQVETFTNVGMITRAEGKQNKFNAITTRSTPDIMEADYFKPANGQDQSPEIRPSKQRTLRVTQ